VTAPFTRGGRGLGAIDLHRVDPSSERYPARELVGAGTTGAARSSMADLVFVPPGYAFADQESTQSCVGWALTQALHVRMRAMGIAPLTPSPLAIYYQARRRAGGAMWDGGCNPLDAWDGLRELGIVPYEQHPYVRAQVDVCPDPGDYRHAADHGWLQYHWVLTEGVARTAEVCSLLASRRPVALAVRVDQSLEDWQGGDSPWTRTGPSLGGHEVVLVGFDTVGLGERVFVFANSWGAGWGDHGYGLISQRQLESSETTYIATPDIDPGKVRM